MADGQQEWAAGAVKQLLHDITGEVDENDNDDLQTFISFTVAGDIDEELLRNEAGDEGVPDHQVERRQERPHNDTMEPVSRPELDAKLQAIEARMDARVASIEGKIDTLLATFNERDKSNADRFARVERELASIASDTKNFKWWLIGLLVPTAVGTVISVAALNSSIVGNVLDGIGAGKDAASANAQVQQQIRETQLLLDEARKAASTPVSSGGTPNLK